MKTITTDLYQFSELSEAAKNKAIEQYYENEQYDFLSEDLKYFIEEKCSCFENVKMSYCLSYSQGDGLSFTCDFNFKEFLKFYVFEEYKKNALCEQFIIKIKSNDYHYYFCSKKDVDFEYNTNMSYFSTDLSNLRKLFDSVFIDIQKEYMSVCKVAQKYGYSIIEYRPDFEEFSELSDVNDYYYNENGILN